MASGGYAEKAVIAVSSLHEIPEQVSAAAAVASIGKGRTTLVALDLAGITQFDVVLVTAAGGGIGNLLVQVAGAGTGTWCRGGGGLLRTRLAGPGTGCARGQEVSLVMDGVGGDALDRAADSLGAAAGS